MTTNRSATDASPHRAGGRLRSRFSVGLAFVGLALIGLTQTGCRSDGCSSCGLGSKLNSGVQSASANVQAFGSKIFNHKKGGCSSCGTLGTVEEGVVVDSGVPVVVEGAVAVPPPGTIVPAPSVAPGPIESAPSQLEAIPAPAGGSASNTPTSGRTTQGASRSAYEASNAKPKNGLIASKRGSDLTRAYDATSPTPAAYARPEEPDVFDNLPPVDLPAELSRKVTPLDDAPSTPKDTKPAAAKVPAEPDAAPLVLPADPVTTSSSERRSAGDAGVSARTAAKPSATRATPGMARSASVATAISGGSLPSAEGLAWLKEKGYKTFVDLRPRSEVDPAFPDQVSDSGMLYVAIPFSVDTINASRLARFNDLLGQVDQRPLYFCDADGRRAGLIWYLRLRSLDREERAMAQAKAEEIGLDAADIDAAEKFLKVNFALTDAEPILPGFLTLQPTGAADPGVVTASASIPTVAAPIVPMQPLARTDSAKGEARNTIEWSDPGPTWKPVAALVLSGLGVPLAYWSKSNLGQRRGPRRASLTAKGPGPRKSLPASDA